MKKKKYHGTIKSSTRNISCLQGQLCGLCLWFWLKRKMRMILWIKITLQKWRRMWALAMLLADGITSTNNPLIHYCNWTLILKVVKPVKFHLNSLMQEIDAKLFTVSDYDCDITWNWVSFSSTELFTLNGEMHQIKQSQTQSFTVNGAPRFPFMSEWFMKHFCVLRSHKWLLSLQATCGPFTLRRGFYAKMNKKNDFPHRNWQNNTQSNSPRW